MTIPSGFDWDTVALRVGVALFFAWCFMARAQVQDVYVTDGNITVQGNVNVDNLGTIESYLSNVDLYLFDISNNFQILTDYGDIEGVDASVSQGQSTPFDQLADDPYNYVSDTSLLGEQQNLSFTALAGPPVYEFDLTDLHTDLGVFRWNLGLLPWTIWVPLLRNILLAMTYFFLSIAAIRITFWVT